VTGPQHYRAAERLTAGLDNDGRRWTDAGWRGLVSEHERHARRQLDLTEAAVHMGLAQVAALTLPATAHAPADEAEWQRAVFGTQDEEDPGAR
jgi:hypothetical protein